MASYDKTALMLKNACIILQPSSEGDDRHLVDALGFGIRSYASRVNAMTGLKRRDNVKSYDRKPVPELCTDFHSECRKWAFGVCSCSFRFLIHDSPWYLNSGRPDQNLIQMVKGELCHCLDTCLPWI